MFAILSKQIHDAGRRLLASPKILDAYKPFATTYYTYLKTQRELRELEELEELKELKELVHKPHPEINREISALEDELVNQFYTVLFGGSVFND